MDHPAFLPAIIGIAAALLGWLLGRSIQRRQAAVELDTALEEHRQSYDVLQKEHTHKAQLMASMQHRQADLERRQAGFDAELNTWKQQLTEMQGHLETARRSYQLVNGEFQAYKAVTNTQLSDLSKINQGLEAHVQAMHKDLQQRDVRMSALQHENETQRGQLEVAHQRYEQYVEAATGQYTDLKSAFSAQTEQLQQREQRIADVERLRDQLQEGNDAWEDTYQEQNARIADLEHLRDQLQEGNDAWEDTYQDQNYRIADLERLRDQLQEGHEAWEASYQQQNGRIADLERLSVQLRETNDDWETLCEEQNDRIADLKRLRDQLQETNEEWQSTWEAQNVHIAGLDDHIADLGRNMRDLTNRYETELESALTDLETYKQRIEHLLAVQQSNSVLIGHLEAEINRLRAGGASATPVGIPVSEDRAAVVLAAVREHADALDFERIGTGSADDADDLERLKGIGPFTARKLNALGLWNYRQLAALTEDDLAIVNEALGFRPGRLRFDF
jgi:predicted flap endonuclease-1-like 5' DNA nuclease